MSSSTVRSMFSTVTGHTVQPNTDVIYYNAQTTWDRYHSPNAAAVTAAPAVGRCSVGYGSNAVVDPMPAQSSSRVPSKVLIPHDRLPPKQLPRGVDPSAYRVVRVVVISDTHEYHERLSIPSQDCDLLMHCGDMLQADRFTLMDRLSTARLKSFAQWFGAQPCRHKVIVAGNHDLALTKLSVPEARALFIKSANSDRTVYLEDEVLRFKEILPMVAAACGGRGGGASSSLSPSSPSPSPLSILDPCAGLTIYGSPRSYPNTTASPNGAFQEPLLWHHSAYGMSYRQLEAYRGLPYVMRRLRDPVTVVLADGTSTFEAHTGRLPADGHSSSGESGKKSKVSPAEGMSPEDDRERFPPYRYALCPRENRNNSDGGDGGGRAPSLGHPMRLVHGPPPVIAHIRIAMQQDVAKVKGSSSNPMASSADESGGHGQGGGKADTNAIVAANVRASCKQGEITKAQRGPLSLVQATNALSADGAAVFGTDAVEVFSVDGYVARMQEGSGGGVPSPSQSSAAASLTGGGAAAAPSSSPPPPPLLPAVAPLRGIDIAMTHQSKTQRLVDFVGAFVQPRLMHAGGHVHEAKGIHAEYSYTSSSCAATPSSSNSNSTPTTTSTSTRRLTVPSVGGAMTQGSFGKEWIQPATVIDLVVPWTAAQRQYMQQHQ